MARASYGVGHWPAMNDQPAQWYVAASWDEEPYRSDPRPLGEDDVRFIVKATRQYDTLARIAEIVGGSHSRAHKSVSVQRGCEVCHLVAGLQKEESDV